MGRVWPEGCASLFGVLIAVACGAGVRTDAEVNSPPSSIISSVRFLTGAALDLWPCFSSDGTQILFSRRVGEGWELFLVPTVGGAAVKLNAAHLPVAETRSNWSKQSNLIAFAGTSYAGQSQIWLIRPDGSSAHAIELAGLSDNIFYPSWYPDGHQIAVMDAGDFSIKRIDLGTGVVVTLTDPKKVYTGMASVSPDGKWIAFAGQQNNGQRYDQRKNSIWLVGDAGVPRLLESNGGQGRAPTWSPSGEQIVFESDRASSAGLYAVFLIKRDGTGITRLTDPALNADHPAWSPDGQHIAFSAHDTAQLGAGRSIGIIDVP